MPLAALHGHVAEDLAHGRAHPLGAVHHDEQRPIEREATLPELAQEARDDAPVLARRLHQAQYALLPRGGDAERDDDLVAREGLPVEHEHEPLGVIMPPL